MTDLIVVIYHKRPEELRALPAMMSFLEKRRDASLILVDNTPGECVLSPDLQKNEQIVYLPNHENLGLPKALNRGIRAAAEDMNRKGDPEGWVLICDDDTEFTARYLMHAAAAGDQILAEGRNIQMVTGLVESGGRPQSPTHRYRRWNSSRNYLRTPGIYEQADCINSGLMIRLSALKAVQGYDEELFLDMADHALMWKLSRAGLSRTLVINERIRQNFSGRSRMPYREQMNRYRIYQKDYRTFCRLTEKGRLYGWTELLKRRIRIELGRVLNHT